MNNERQVEPILIDKQRGRDVSNLSIRTLEYRIASGEIETRKIGKRRLIVYKSLVRWLARDHPSRIADTAEKHMQPEAEGEAAAAR